jgi:hypothetical protein
MLFNAIAGLAHADALPIPATRYPSGTRITYFPAVSNATMDCQWGFICEGNVPLFHLQLQDQLHRITGWAQYAVWNHSHKKMQFVVYASQYAPDIDLERRPWSRAAFDDFRAAIHAQGYKPLRDEPSLLPKGGDGGTVAALQRSGPDDLIVVAAWTSSHEVEAIAVFSHRSPGARRVALTYLARQVRAAIHDISG